MSYTTVPKKGANDLFFFGIFRYTQRVKSCCQTSALLGCAKYLSFLLLLLTASIQMVSITSK